MHKPCIVIKFVTPTIIEGEDYCPEVGDWVFANNELTEITISNRHQNFKGKIKFITPPSNTVRVSHNPNDWGYNYVKIAFVIR